MKKIIMILTSFLCYNLSHASGGGGGGSGGSGGAAAGGGAVSRSKEAQPAKVYEARKEMRKRIREKNIENSTKSNARFDHNFKSTTSLLNKSVSFRSNNQKSIVNYKALSKSEIDAAAKELLSANKTKVMKTFSPKQRLAYFINLYNVLTLKLIKDNYKKIKGDSNSINDLGSFLNKPWDKKFFKLFGKDHTLNDIEHGFIRGDKSGFARHKKEYKDPRIHFAVNCASKGCPALLKEAFTPEKLDNQMQTAMVNFLKDRSRNYIKGNKLYLSPIISSWYEKDFSRGLGGYTSVKDFAAKNAQYLSEDSDMINKIKQKKLSIGKSNYDWTLNDAI